MWVQSGALENKKKHQFMACQTLDNNIAQDTTI
jgi:hypothetical protein